MSQSTAELNELIKQNRENGWSNLSDSQKLFCMAYVESYTIVSAAEYAGVSKSAASRWLREPLVLEFINDLQAHLNNRSVITKDFVNLQWLKLMPKLLGEEAVPMIDKDGCTFEAKKFHAGEAVSLLKELSKSTDFYKTDDDGAPVNTKPQRVEFVIRTKQEVDNE